MTTLANMTARLRGRRKPTNEAVRWDECPEWLRAQGQGDKLRADAQRAADALGEAELRASGLRAAVERAEVAALLGDDTAENADALRAELTAAELAVTDARRQVSRFEAAVRELDSRSATLQRDLQRRFAEQWREQYADSLTHAARAAVEAQAAQQELARIWADRDEAADADTPGPLPALLTSGSVAQWLAAVRHFGVEE